MRIRALISKEFLDLARNRMALLPVLVVTVLALAFPFFITIGIPALTGEALVTDSDIAKASLVIGPHRELSGEAVVQLFLFQQFLFVFMLIPITGAMALAAHSVVGEKQARTLEPLLATPITTFELLVAKVLGAFLPTLAIVVVGLALYFGGIVMLAEPGVARAMADVRTAVLIFLVGPAAALVSLQAAIVISSRVNDPRTAQQFGVLIIIPLSALLVAQFIGTLWLSPGALALIGFGLAAVWVLLTLFSIVLFDRETILTRWR
jgi:ABC-2 type transport system permease protein